MNVKDIIVKPITQKSAKELVCQYHYSGSVAMTSQLHFGVFLDGKCGGAMQFGSSIDKNKTIGLVEGTKWNGFIELNRMAFADWLPKNSESRSISVALRIIKKEYPHIEWVLSYADGTQCGDGTIYRASGFVLTAIKKNKTIMRLPDGKIVTDKTLNSHPVQNSGWWKKRGATSLVGFQLRYIYFLNPEAKKRLSVPIVPFSEIDKVGAKMYKGKVFCVSSADSGTLGFQPRGGGANPTDTLQFQNV